MAPLPARPAHHRAARRCDARVVVCFLRAAEPATAIAAVIPQHLAGALRSLRHGPVAGLDGCRASVYALSSTPRRPRVRCVSLEPSLIASNPVGGTDNSFDRDFVRTCAREFRGAGRLNPRTGDAESLHEAKLTCSIGAKDNSPGSASRRAQPRVNVPQNNLPSASNVGNFFGNSFGSTRGPQSSRGSISLSTMRLPGGSKIIVPFR